MYEIERGKEGDIKMHFSFGMRNGDFFIFRTRASGFGRGAEKNIETERENNDKKIAPEVKRNEARRQQGRKKSKQGGEI